MEDGISRGLQHRHETCCKKGGRHRRQACMVQRWFHHGDVVSGPVDFVYDINTRELSKVSSIDVSTLYTSNIMSYINKSYLFI